MGSQDRHTWVRSGEGLTCGQAGSHKGAVGEQHGRKGQASHSAAQRPPLWLSLPSRASGWDRMCTISGSPSMFMALSSSWP